jgi:serine/threonine protein kinase
LDFFDSTDRDLKPENVLIGADGNLCLTDFGLSKESVQDNELVHTFVGTTEYLAPEILRQRGYSKAVDWWSLGVLLCVTHLETWRLFLLTVYFQTVFFNVLLSKPCLLTVYFQLRDGRRLASVLFQK